MKTVVLAVIVSVFLSGFAEGGHIITWDDETGCGPLPDTNDFSAIATGLYHKLALRIDGSIFACGHNFWGEVNVPPGEYVAIGAGYSHSLAICSDGTLAAWGENDQGQCDVPPGNDYVAVAGGWDFSVALHSDGSIVMWGREIDCLECIPPPDTNGFVMIDCGGDHCLALHEDGSITAWGSDGVGACNVPDDNDFIEIGAGWQSVAIHADGTMWGAGGNWTPECVPTIDPNHPNEPIGCDPPLLYKAVDTGNKTLVIRDDGTLGAWGGGRTWNLPDINSCVDVSCCQENAMALTSNDSMILTVHTEPNGMQAIIPGLGEHPYYYGQRISIEAPRSPRCPDVYGFTHWSGDAPDPNAQAQYITMDSDKTVTAHYVADTRKCGDECHPIQQGDMNGDCRINFDDFAVYAASWLSCTHPECD